MTASTQDFTCFWRKRGRLVSRAFLQRDKQPETFEEQIARVAAERTSTKVHKNWAITNYSGLRQRSSLLRDTKIHIPKSASAFLLIASVVLFFCDKDVGGCAVLCAGLFLRARDRA